MSILHFSASFAFSAPPLSVCVNSRSHSCDNDQKLRELVGKDCVCSHAHACPCRSVSGRVRVLCDAWLMSLTLSSQPLYTHTRPHKHGQDCHRNSLSSHYHTVQPAFLTCARQQKYLYTLDHRYWSSPRTTARTLSPPSPFFSQAPQNGAQGQLSSERYVFPISCRL